MKKILTLIILFIFVQRVNAQMSVQDSVTNENCFGDSSGVAIVHVHGGVAPYSFLWNTIPVQTDSVAIYLPAGNFIVTITDLNSVSINDTVTISQPTFISLTTGHTNSTCTGSNGTAWVTPSGGTPGYTYLWTPSSQTADTATGLPQQTYSIYVTDSHGCVAGVYVSVGGVTPTIITSSHVNCNCFGEHSGSASVNVSGGIPPYTYTWSPPGGIGPNLTNLPVGNYFIYIHNNNGCPDDTVNFTITEPAQLVANYFVTNASCATCCDGTAIINGSGGTPPYTYISVPANPNFPNSLCAGVHHFYITDSHGCQTSIDSFTINVGAGIFSLNQNTFSVYPNPASAKIYLNSTGEIKNAQIVIYDLQGGKCFEQNYFSDEVDVSSLPIGMYFLNVISNKEKWEQKFMKE